MTSSAGQVLERLLQEADGVCARWDPTTKDAWGLVQHAKALKGRIMTTVAWGQKEPHYSVYVAVAQLTAIQAEFDIYVQDKTDRGAQ